MTANPDVVATGQDLCPVSLFRCVVELEEIVGAQPILWRKTVCLLL